MLTANIMIISSDLIWNISLYTCIIQLSWPLRWTTKCVIFQISRVISNYLCCTNRWCTISSWISNTSLRTVIYSICLHLIFFLSWFSKFSVSWFYNIRIICLIFYILFCIRISRLRNCFIDWDIISFYFCLINITVHSIGMGNVTRSSKPETNGHTNCANC